MARISPQPSSDWSQELKTFVEEFRASTAAKRTTPTARGGIRPAGANVIGTFARHPDLAKAFLVLNGHVLYGSTLSSRQRELLILRVAALRKCDYEWAQHVVLAEDAGMTADEISRIIEGPGAPGWAPADQILLEAVDELIDTAEVSADTWKVLAQDLDERQLMDLVFTVGTYELVAMAFRSFGLGPEPELVPYLPTGW
ncbi:MULTISPECIES: carboxymuconolactone decarboxylase family protein [unclassified Pseudofrankia]|uniref:carboxymuconolactone decarboxylase family protein n=1 Tax=unclassified Pseudofrankia TaxID=2994372 RepID=UPI0008D8E30E|nr:MULTISPECIES: carboxymuconolactone decarboxylase family protein [unclassified Pseudofrankia]MDT3439884.1 carboxymuconolactone decarboxylase family protein [Pseudofrankia sp. BMG5.37]OHV48360.1 carboxymuconolactone decarboxylase [Pseudofrankia sp. BMG5.36]